MSWWVDLLDTCLIERPDPTDGPDAPADPAEDLDTDDADAEGDEDEVVEAVDDALPPVLLDLYSAGRIRLQDLDTAVGQTVREILDSLFAATNLPEEQVQALARIFHDLDAERRLTCTNAVCGLHRFRAAQEGQSGASVQVTTLIHHLRLRP